MPEKKRPVRHDVVDVAAAIFVERVRAFRVRLNEGCSADRGTRPDGRTAAARQRARGRSALTRLGLRLYARCKLSRDLSRN